MSKKGLLVSAAIVVLLLATIFAIFTRLRSNGPRPAVQFLSYTNIKDLRMALFVVSNSTSVPINFRTTPEYYTGSETMPYFMPLPSGQTYLVTVPWSPSTTSVKFGFVARHTYCWTLNDALRNSGIKGAAKVTKERLSGITYFGKKSEYDLEIGLP